ncbi:MAG: prepilin peptidase [Acidimicrobiia bacterium]
MFTFVLVVCGILGLAVGSFLNVVIWRVPHRDEAEPTASEPIDAETLHAHSDADVDVRDATRLERAPEATPRETIFRPPSYCPGCHTPIKPYDNIPVVSWLLLRARCRTCKTRIPIRYPMVELANAVLFVLVALVYWDRPELIAYLILAAGLLALSVIDIELKILPTRVVFPLGVMVALALGGAALWNRDWHPALRALGGGAAAYVVIRFIYEVTRGRGIGYGDVRLSFVLGMALGWLGWEYVVGGIFGGFFLGAVLGLLLLALRIVARRTPIPFGPFLAAGTMIFVLLGAPILDWYLGRA